MYYLFSLLFADDLQALYLARIAENKRGVDFIKWLSNLSEEEIEQFDFNNYDKKNVHNISLRLTTNKYPIIPSEFQFEIKGISYSEDRKKASLNIMVGDKLNYSRDMENRFDPFAIKISKNSVEVGYVPRELSKLIAVEIDISSSIYEMEVLSTTLYGTQNSVVVQMKKVTS